MAKSLKDWLRDNPLAYPTDWSEQIQKWIEYAEESPIKFDELDRRVLDRYLELYESGNFVVDLGRHRRSTGVSDYWKGLWNDLDQER